MSDTHFPWRVPAPFPRSQGLVLEPSEGEVPPASSSGGGGGALLISAVLTVEGAGALGGDISVVLQGSSAEEAKRLAFCATGVTHTFDLVESSGVIVSEVSLKGGALWGSDKQWQRGGGRKSASTHYHEGGVQSQQGSSCANRAAALIHCC